MYSDRNEVRRRRLAQILFGDGMAATGWLEMGRAGLVRNYSTVPSIATRVRANQYAKLYRVDVDNYGRPKCSPGARRL